MSRTARTEMSRFAVLDMPKDRKKTDELLEYRDMFDSSYAAFYHPWIQIFDPLSKKNVFAPPSGLSAWRLRAH